MGFDLKVYIRSFSIHINFTSAHLTLFSLFLIQRETYSLWEFYSNISNDTVGFKNRRIFEYENILIIHED